MYRSARYLASLHDTRSNATYGMGHASGRSEAQRASDEAKTSDDER